MSDIASTLPVTDSADGVTGSAVPAKTMQVGGKDGSSNLRTLLTDTTGILQTAIPNSTSTSSIIASGGASSFICNGLSTVTINISGSFGGATLVFESSQDGINFASCVAYEISGGVSAPTVAAVTSVNSIGVFVIPSAGYAQVRVRATALTSGTVSNMFTGSIGQMFTPVVNTTATNLQTTARLNDGAGTSVTVGQKTMASSLPVVIASDQNTLPLPTGAATSANQSTEITSLQLIDNPVGSVAAGTAGTNSYLIGGVFNTSLPTLTNGQQAAIQFDSSGRLVVSPTTVTITKAPLSPASGTAVSIAATSTSAVASNASRKGLVLTNTSTHNISLGLGVAAVLNSGITLYPGGVWVMDEYTYTTGAINAIASVASSNLAVQEFN